MTSTTTNTARTPFIATATSALAAVAGALNSFMELRARAALMERLCAMSDSQLADIGMQRQDIPNRVFNTPLEG